MRKSFALLLLSACAAHVTGADVAWHHPLYLANHGYWPKRLPIVMTNDSAHALAGVPVRVAITPLAGEDVRSLRVCRADGVELLFELRDGSGAAKRSGAVSADDRLFIPAEVAAHGAAEVFVYAGNKRAWPVPDFLSEENRGDGSLSTPEALPDGLHLGVEPVETRRLREITEGGATEASTSPYECRMSVRNFGDTKIEHALVYADLAPALAAIGPEARDWDVVVGSGEARRASIRLQSGRTLLFPAALEPRSKTVFRAAVKRVDRARSPAQTNYVALLHDRVNLVPGGDFEDAAAIASAWFPPSGVSGVSFGPSPDAKWGGHSLQLKLMDNPQSAWVGWRSREIPVKPGAAYLLSGYLKAIGLKAPAMIHAHWHDAAGNLTASGAFSSTSPPVQGDSDWVNSLAFLHAPPDAASVQIHLTMNTAGTLRHDGILLAEVTPADLLGVESSAADKAALHVWQVNPLVKVFPETLPGAPETTVSVELGRNEFEPIQLALRGKSAQQAAAVSVSVSPLRNADGATLPIEINRVGFIPIDHPSAYYRSDLPAWCRQVPAGHAATDGWAGRWPDPLLPNAPFDLADDETQPLWLTIHAPDDAVSGEYRATVTIRAGDASISLPLIARVLPFTLPGETRLRAIFDFRRGPGGWFGAKGNSPAEFRKWLRFMADHRLGIDRIEPEPQFHYENGKVSMDTRGFDEMAGYCFDELGMNVAYTPSVFYMFGWAYPPKKLFGLDPFTPEWTSALQQAYRLFSEHVRAKGWHDKFVYYISDEPHFDHDFVVQQMKKLCALLHEVDDEIPIYSSTWRHCPAWDQSLDLWGIGQYGCFPVDEMKRLQRAGRQMWFTCDGQMATDTPYLATERMLPYYCFKYGARGFEFWGLTWWTYNPYEIGWHRFIRQSDEGKNYYWVRYPDGDGYLAYPGGPLGLDEPVSTIRLEQVREGLEDSEAIHLLAQLAAKAQAAGHRNASADAALRQARDLVQIPNAGGLRSTEILPDPDEIPGIRHAINAALVELLGGEVR